MKSKICSKCKQKKSLKDFHKDKARPDGHTYRCKSCLCKYARKYAESHSKQIAEYRNQHREKRREQGRKYYQKHRKKYQKYWFKYKYNLTLEQRKQLYVDQNGCCSICGIPISYDKTNVDHDHETGKVRGLLCINCNTRLPIIEDKNSVEKAEKYLRNNTI